MVVKRVVVFILLLNIILVEGVFALGSISIIKPQNFPLSLKFVAQELLEKKQVEVFIRNDNDKQLAPVLAEKNKEQLVFSIGESANSADYHIELRQDPERVLQFLKLNLPAISTIHLVALERDADYSHSAELAAETLGLELQIHQATSDKLNKVYLEAFDNIDPANELLWVSHKIDEKVRFYMLEKSWKSKAVLVANYTSYVKQGMLIGFGIDIKTLEQEIVNIIISTLDSTSAEGNIRLYLSNLLTGLNKISAKRSPHIKNRQKWTVFDKRF